ncbi:MAG: hypothetical protein RR646_08150 [Erysipelotrichaceae bacterium]
MDKRKLKKVINFIFSFFIAFFIFLVLIMTSTRFSVMNERYFIKTLDKVDYYKNTALELNRFIRLNAVPSGFPTEMFEGYITEEDIRSDMIEYEMKMFNHEEADISTKKIDKRIRNTVNTYIVKNNIIMNESLDIGVEAFITAIVKQYSYLTKFPYINMYADLVTRFNKIYVIATPILLTLIAVLTVLMIKINTRAKRRREYGSYVFIGSGLLVGALPTVMLAEKFFQKISLNPKYMYDLIVALGRNYLIINVILGLILIGVGLLLILVKIKKKESRQKSRNSMLMKNIVHEN